MATRVTINRAKAAAYLHDASEDFGDYVAAAVADDARRGAPVDTGYLRSTIYWVRMPGTGRLTWRIGATAAYARFVERGTRYMAAQPFLRPALYRQRTTAANKAHNDARKAASAQRKAAREAKKASTS